MIKNNFKMKVVMGKQPYLQFNSSVGKQILETGATKLRLRHTFTGDLTYISFFKEDNEQSGETSYKLTKRTNTLTVSSRKLAREICKDFGIKFDENKKDQVSFYLICNTNKDCDSLIEFEIQRVDFDSLIIPDENVDETEQESDVETNVVDFEKDTDGNIKSVTIVHTIENEKQEEPTLQFSVEIAHNGFIISNGKVKKVYEGENNTFVSILAEHIQDWIGNRIAKDCTSDNFNVKITITENENS